MANKKIIATSVVSLALLSLVCVKPAMAYFTDSVYAKGTVAVEMGNTPTNSTETVENMIKTISIENTGSHDAFIRVSAIHGGNCTVSLLESEGWSLQGEYYVYDQVVAPNASTTELKLQVTPKDGLTDDFNVIITQEATQVHYDENGKPFATWDKVYSNKGGMQ